MKQNYACFSNLMLPNHSITFWVFFHSVKVYRIFLKLELILSRMILLGFPDSLLAGLISRYSSTFWVVFEILFMVFNEINALRFSFVQSGRQILNFLKYVLARHRFAAGAF